MVDLQAKVNAAIGEELATIRSGEPGIQGPPGEPGEQGLPGPAGEHGGATGEAG